MLCSRAAVVKSPGRTARPIQDFGPLDAGGRVAVLGCGGAGLIAAQVRPPTQADEALREREGSKIIGRKVQGTAELAAWT